MDPETFWKLGAGWSLLFVAHMSLFLAIPTLNGVTPSWVNPGVVRRTELNGSGDAGRVVLVVVAGLGHDLFSKAYRGGALPYLGGKIAKEGSLWKATVKSQSNHKLNALFTMISGYNHEDSKLLWGKNKQPVRTDSIFDHSKAYYFGDSLTHSYLGNSIEKITPAEPQVWRTYASTDELSMRSMQEAIVNSVTGSNRMFFNGNVVMLIRLTTLENYCSVQPCNSSDAEVKLLKGLEKLIAKFEKMLDVFCGSDQTAYIVTGDLGQQEGKDPKQLPLVVWGKGIKKAAIPPNSTLNEVGSWSGSGGGVDTADIAPLVSCLLGTRFPIHSLGRVPFDLMDVSDQYEMLCASNRAFQIANHLDALYKKNKVKGMFSPSLIPQLNNLKKELQKRLSRGSLYGVKRTAEVLVELCKTGFIYYYTFERYCLLYCTILSTVGLIVYLIWQMMRPDAIGSGVNVVEPRFIVCKMLKLNLQGLMALIVLTLLAIMIYEAWLFSQQFVVFTCLLIWWQVIRNIFGIVAVLRSSSKGKFIRFLRFASPYTLILVLTILFLGREVSLALIFAATILYIYFMETETANGGRSGEWLISSIPLMLLLQYGIANEGLSLTLLVPSVAVWIIVILAALVSTRPPTREWSYLIFCCFCMLAELAATVLLYMNKKIQKSEPNMIFVITFFTSLLPIVWLPFAHFEYVSTKIFHYVVCISVPLIALSIRHEPLAYFLISIHLLAWLLLEAFPLSTMKDFLKVKMSEIPRPSDHKLRAADVRRALLAFVYTLIFLQIFGLTEKVHVAFTYGLAPTLYQSLRIFMGGVKGACVILSVLFFYIVSSKLREAQPAKTFFACMSSTAFGNLLAQIVVLSNMEQPYQKQSDALAQYTHFVMVSFGFLVLYPLCYTFTVGNKADDRGATASDNDIPISDG